MTVEAAVFTCSICGEPSRDICVSCTKDACANHRCERCKRCSDCCECEVPLSAAEVSEIEQSPAPSETASEATPVAGHDSDNPAVQPTPVVPPVAAATPVPPVSGAPFAPFAEPAPAAQPVREIHTAQPVEPAPVAEPASADPALSGSNEASLRSEEIEP